MRRLVMFRTAVLLLLGAAMLIRAAAMPRLDDSAAFQQRLDVLVAEHRTAWQVAMERFPAQTALPSADTQWWWTIVGLAWLYIYLAMAATRRAPYLYADLEPEWPPAWNTR